MFENDNIDLSDAKNDNKSQKTPISKWDYSKKEKNLILYLEDGRIYCVNIDENFLAKWKKIDWSERTEVFYKVLINKAHLAR